MAALAGSEGVYEGRDRKAKAPKWAGSRVDLIFGSHSQLRALAEVYAFSNAKEVRGLRRSMGQGDERRPLRSPPEAENGGPIIMQKPAYGGLFTGLLHTSTIPGPIRSRSRAAE